MFCNKMLRLQQLYRVATLLALITIFYNIAEGIVSVWFGTEDETIALFGFGLDSFVEVISGIGIWHMVRRLNLLLPYNRRLNWVRNRENTISPSMQTGHFIQI